MTTALELRPRQDLVASVRLRLDAEGTPWPVVVDAFLAAAVDSDNTRRAYRRHLATAFAAIGQPSLATITGADLAAYRSQVVGSGLSPSSQSQALAALRSFLAWSRSMGAHALPSEVIGAALRMPRSAVLRPYTILAEPEVAALLAAAATPRDRALLAVLLGAGLRAAESVGLDVADLIEDQDGALALHVRQGKGRKDRIVPIRADVAGLIKGYLAATGRHLGSDGPLFRSHDRGAPKRTRARLTVRAVGFVVARCAAAAGISAKRISPHSLRHSFAIRALRHGANVVSVGKLLGHSSIATTQKYLDHLNLAELRLAVPWLP